MSPLLAGGKKVIFSCRRSQREAKKLSFQVAAVCGRVKSILFRLTQFLFIG